MNSNRERQLRILVKNYYQVQRKDPSQNELQESNKQAKTIY